MRISSETRWAWLFIAPCLLGLLLFTYLPILGSFGLSFAYWNLLGMPRFVGLDNYQHVLGMPLFWQSLCTTISFVCVTGVLEVLLGLGLAVLLDQVKAFKSVLQAAYFLPFVTPMVSVAMVWGWLYDPSYGLINWVLSQLHLIQTPVPWLYSEQTALWAVIILGVWKSVGYNMIIFLSGLQAVSPTLYEASELDGCGVWSKFWSVTLPLISPTVFFVTTMSMIQGFQVFDSVYLLTQGGPAHHTELLVYWMFKNAFEYYKVGEASAIAYMLFVLILLLTLIQWGVRKYWVLYEDNA
jgi:multiple sugar transport system permease protein